MARGGKKQVSTAAAAADPEADERTRLKEFAFAKHILSQNPAKIGPSTALAPSKTVIKHHGKDIQRKSQRKNRYLFSFPGLLGPSSGGKIGELKDLATKNPILYLDFPQGQMKLFGTIVYPKNRYLTLQFSKGGKNVTCDDYFDNMIVFSDAWWIGTKDENPEESRLQFPKELNLAQEKQAQYDFKGGVGATSDIKQGSGTYPKKCPEMESPEHDLEGDLTDSPNDFKELVEVTPTRHSARTAGKKFNFAEPSSEEGFVGNGVDTPEEEDEKVDIETTRNDTCTETESLSPVVFEVDDQDGAKEYHPASGKNKRANIKDFSDATQTSLVQTTLSTLYKKAEEKKAQKDAKEKINSSEVSKFMRVGKKIEEQDTGVASKGRKKQLKKAEVVDFVTAHKGKSTSKTAGASTSKKGQANLVSASQSSDPIDSSQAADDDIEEFSSSSQDIDVSDEDWTA